MTKTLLLSVVAFATAHVAMAQVVFVTPRPRPLPAPLVVPAPVAPAAVPVQAPFEVPPAPPADPQAPQVAVPPVPPMVVEPFDFHFEDFKNFEDFKRFKDFKDFAIDVDPALQDLGYSLGILKDALKDQKFELKGPFALAQLPPQPAQPPQPPQRPQPAPFVRVGTPEEASYDQARSFIERDQYDRALPILDRVIQSKGGRVDAAMYWKAYSLAKLARRPEALTVLTDLQKEFPSGAWQQLDLTPNTQVGAVQVVAGAGVFGRIRTNPVKVFLRVVFQLEFGPQDGAVMPRLQPSRPDVERFVQLVRERPGHIDEDLVAEDVGTVARTDGESAAAGDAQARIPAVDIALEAFEDLGLLRPFTGGVDETRIRISPMSNRASRRG